MIKLQSSQRFVPLSGILNLVFSATLVCLVDHFGKNNQVLALGQSRLFSSVINTNLENERVDDLTFKSSGIENLNSLINLYDQLDVSRLKERPSCVFHPQSTYRLSTIEILRREGYPTETHYVKADDGYIIELHRIPAPGQPVAYALAGILQSSRDFVINCKGRALGPKLFNNGFDVWLGNFRGNSYGRNHTHLSPNKREFWEFSTDDIIAHDSPAIIDYILEKTGQPKLNWIGFSLGNTILFGLLASRPEYNDKINLGVALGPAVYFGKTKNAVIRFFARHQRLIEKFVFKVFHGEILPPTLTAIGQKFGPKFCEGGASRGGPSICSFLLGIVDGQDPLQTNYANIPLVVGGWPSPTSARVISQWFQWIIFSNNQFTKYDFGLEGNIRNYGSSVPPIYDVRNISVPIVTFWADNDQLTPKENVLELVRDLPKVEANIHVKLKSWNHMDNAYGKDADVLVYDFAVHILKENSFNKRVSLLRAKQYSA